MKITVVVSAYRLSEGQIHQFLEWNEVVFKMNDVHVLVVTDREVQLKYGKCLVYPKKPRHLSLPRLNNYGIKRAEGIVIKTDLDIIFSDKIIKRIKQVVQNNYAFIGICANIDQCSEIQEKPWEDLPKRFWGWGACFAMTRHDWGMLHGYNEKIWGWGDDDHDMFRRVQDKLCLSLCSYYPLFHMNHKQRKSVEPDSFFPIRKDENSKLVWTDWHEEEWGEGKYD